MKIQETKEIINYLLDNNLRLAEEGKNKIAINLEGKPGIGKTAIIKSTIKDMAQSKWHAINLNLEIISLSGYTIE